MKLLLADSGSTKTDWRLSDEKGTILSFRTEGYNPYLVSGEKIAEGLRNDLLPALNGTVPEQLFFYGAGCGAPDKKQIVSEALHVVFPGAEIQVETDLLGAARALCGRQAGIAAILGTGSNSCYYDGEKIVENRPSLGFILGDEGSGAAIGKELIRLFLYGEMEAKLQSNFENRFQLDKNKILDQVYRQPLPNRFLASFAKFVFQNIEQEQCSTIVTNSFRDFFRYHILKYGEASRSSLHVTGSIGFYFSNLLRRVAEEQGIRLGRITENPISGLVNFHLGEDL